MVSLSSKKFILKEAVNHKDIFADTFLLKYSDVLLVKKRIEKEIKETNKELEKEPCCKWNIEGDHFYCQFHRLQKIIEKEFEGEEET